MAEKILQVKNLQVSFRTREGLLKAVRDVSFDLIRGETLSIVGESGSGKSVTSKAIIGILSGNSIVEGGEILFEGQDLLKIDEENFHKIRGDKISMIFQDPLSALNPIMRVGKQVTEAMILNGKARQSSAKKEFNYRLKLLNKYLNIVEPDKIDDNKVLCDKFNLLNIEACKLERAYNVAIENLVNAKNSFSQLHFLLEKNQKINFASSVKKALKYLDKTINPFIVTDKSLLEPFVSSNLKKISKEEMIKYCDDVLAFVEKYIKLEKPNFINAGYYAAFDKDTFISSSPVELAKKPCKELEKFMDEFDKAGKKAIIFAHHESLDKKKVTLEKVKAFRSSIESLDNFNKPSIKKDLKELKKSVKDSIEYMSTVRRSDEYSFGISIDHEFARYAEGLKINPKNLRKNQRQQAKFDKLIQKGKNPTWKVIPPYLVDLELTKSNIFKILDNLAKSYNHQFEKLATYDVDKQMRKLRNLFSEQASRFVYKVTKGIAKAKALELFKEVGIPEPELRFYQYPFEFSGGMRQRVVIAIALAANPDILICDEPTTALDVTIQSQILELINKIKKERNLSVIFITHDLGVVANMADRIAVMYAGKIVEYGTSEDIFYDPRHPYTWALLSSMPDLDTKEKLESIPGTPPNMIYPPVGDAFADRNAYALKIDYEKQPPLFEISDSHFAATWLLHPNAPKVNPPKSVVERIKRMKSKGGKK